MRDFFAVLHHTSADATGQAITKQLQTTSMLLDLSGRSLWLLADSVYVVMQLAQIQQVKLYLHNAVHPQALIAQVILAYKRQCARYGSNNLATLSITWQQSGYQQLATWQNSVYPHLYTGTLSAHSATTAIAIDWQVTPSSRQWRCISSVAQLQRNELYSLNHGIALREEHWVELLHVANGIYVPESEQERHNAGENREIVENE